MCIFRNLDPPVLSLRVCKQQKGCTTVCISYMIVIYIHGILVHNSSDRCVSVLDHTASMYSVSLQDVQHCMTGSVLCKALSGLSLTGNYVPGL